MDRDQFDHLSRLVAAAGTRRDAVRLLVAGTIAGAGGVGAAAARKRRDRGRQRGRVRAEQVLNCTDRNCVNCANKRIGPGVNLTRCDLNRRIDLAGTNLGGSNLTKTCLGDADLRNVRFRGANVSGACFCGSDLFGADFRGSNVTAAQLACATVGCDTILPNGKRAVVCETGLTCCDGQCVNLDADPTDCGACGNDCGVCRTCLNGQCIDKPNGAVSCKGIGLDQRGDLLCTSNPSDGICVDGTCDCGGGVYDPDRNVCLCDQGNTQLCANNQPPLQCCQVAELCLNPLGGITELTQCIECD